MASFKVGSYMYTFDARAGAVEAMVLWSAPSANAAPQKLARIAFIDDAAPVPEPVVAANSSYAEVSFKRSALAGLVDMLRNENPVFLSIAAAPFKTVKIGTEAEAVGEGESESGQ